MHILHASDVPRINKCTVWSCLKRSCFAWCRIQISRIFVQD